MRPSKRWLKTAEVYKHFSRAATETGFVCDFSEQAALEMFVFESQGKGRVARDNGFAIGKKWLDVTLASWLDDLNASPPMLRAFELYGDPEIPNWWLDKVIPQRIRERDMDWQNWA